jgi:hypothetical protein
MTVNEAADKLIQDTTARGKAIREAVLAQLKTRHKAWNLYSQSGLDLRGEYDGVYIRADLVLERKGDSRSYRRGYSGKLRFRMDYPRGGVQSFPEPKGGFNVTVLADRISALIADEKASAIAHEAAIHRKEEFTQQAAALNKAHGVTKFGSTAWVDEAYGSGLQVHVPKRLSYAQAETILKAVLDVLVEGE